MISLPNKPQVAACEHLRTLGNSHSMVCLDCYADVPTHPIEPLTPIQQEKVHAVLDYAQSAGVLSADEAARLWALWQEAVASG